MRNFFNFLPKKIENCIFNSIVKYPADKAEFVIEYVVWVITEERGDKRIHILLYK